MCAAGFRMLQSWDIRSSVFLAIQMPSRLSPLIEEVPELLSATV